MVANIIKSDRFREGHFLIWQKRVHLLLLHFILCTLLTH